MYGQFRKCGILFFLREKYLMVHFRGRFRRVRGIFDLQIVPSAAKDNLEVKNVEAKLEYPEIINHYILFPKTKNNILTL